MTRLALLLLAALGCTPAADTGPAVPEDSDADTDTDADGDTDTGPAPVEYWETTGDCPELEEVQALPEAGGEVLYAGEALWSVDFQGDSVLTAVFEDAATWEAFVAASGLGIVFTEPVDFDGALVLMGAAQDRTTCGTDALEVHEVVLVDGTRHLDVTLHGNAGDDCDMSAYGGAFLRVPEGPASVCARRHEYVR